MSHHCVAFSWQLRANVSSSIKPEVYNVSQRHQKRTYPTDIFNTHKKLGEDRMRNSGDMLADRQTDRQSSQYSAHLSGAE